MAKPLPAIDLTRDEKGALNRIINKRRSPQGLVKRAHIVLLANEMKSTDEIMETLSVSRSTVIKWRRNFLEKRLDGLADAPPGMMCIIGVSTSKNPLLSKNCRIFVIIELLN